MIQQDIRWIQRFEYTHELAWYETDTIQSLFDVNSSNSADKSVVF